MFLEHKFIRVICESPFLLFLSLSSSSWMQSLSRFLSTLQGPVIFSQCVCVRARGLRLLWNPPGLFCWFQDPEPISGPIHTCTWWCPGACEEHMPVRAAGGCVGRQERYGALWRRRIEAQWKMPDWFSLCRFLIG